jgi:ABC-type sugar transport system permease subunit
VVAHGTLFLLPWVCCCDVLQTIFYLLFNYDLLLLNYLFLLPLGLKQILPLSIKPVFMKKKKTETSLI